MTENEIKRETDQSQYDETFDKNRKEVERFFETLNRLGHPNHTIGILWKSEIRLSALKKLNDWMENNGDKAEEILDKVFPEDLISREE